MEPGPHRLQEVLAKVGLDRVLYCMERSYFNTERLVTRSSRLTVPIQKGLASVRISVICSADVCRCGYLKQEQQGRAALQQHAQPLDDVRRQLAQIGQCSVSDPAPRDSYLATTPLKPNGRSALLSGRFL